MKSGDVQRYTVLPAMVMIVMCGNLSTRQKQSHPANKSSVKVRDVGSNKPINQKPRRFTPRKV